MNEHQDIQCQVSAIADAPLPSQNITIANEYLQTIYRRLALVTVLIPCLGTVTAIELLWDLGIGVIEIGLLLGMYGLTTLLFPVQQLSD